MTGGHDTHARVPPGEWARQALHLARNHYDRLSHFARGFIPAILAREVLLRGSPLVRGKWLFLTVTSICLAFSAFGTANALGFGLGGMTAWILAESRRSHPPGGGKMV